ncbi:hypothetical protein VNO80_04204 [Phaseolus coccineus]|uniref:Uncharacterized protein n=1 Tax=Phaseolus coccineus TaxID=3886 RepID=A0AAN9NXH2_PHACN
MAYATPGPVHATRKWRSFICNEPPPLQLVRAVEVVRFDRVGVLVHSGYVGQAIETIAVMKCFFSNHWDQCLFLCLKQVIFHA